MFGQLPEGVWTEDIEKHPLRQYSFEYLGYKCEIKRNNFSAYCGYVTIPNTHPDFGTHDMDMDVDIHGGLTYSDETGKFGFDCAHMNDIVPALETLNKTMPDLFKKFGNEEKHYWTFEEVENEVKKLAQTFKERENLGQNTTGIGNESVDEKDLSISI
jgi:hypothetical protein